MPKHCTPRFVVLFSGRGRSFFFPGLVLALFFSSMPNVAAQSGRDALWQRSYGGSGDDKLWQIHSTSNGGFIVAGSSDSGTNGTKTSPNLGGSDFWILRLDSNGNKIWERTFGGMALDEAHAAMETADGGFIVGGWSASPSNATTKTSASFGNNDYWLLRLDANGNKLWERSFGGSGNDRLYDFVEVDGNGFALAGSSTSAAGSGNKTSTAFGGEDFWLVRLDANGNKLWEKSFGGSDDDEARTICRTGDGGFLLGGDSSSPSSGNRTSAGFGGVDYWVVKVDSNGTKVAEFTYGGTGNDFLRVVREDAGGDLLLAGYSASGANGNKTVASYGNQDGWLVRVSALGSNIWQRRFGAGRDDTLEGFDSLPGGGFAVGLLTDSGSAGNRDQTNFGGYDYWILGLDSGGNIAWNVALGGSGYEELRSLTHGTDGAVVVGGFSSSPRSQLRIDGNKIAPLFGNNDVWIAKVGTDPALAPPRIISPGSNAVVSAGSNVPFGVDVSPISSLVTAVDLLQGTNLLRHITNAPYSMVLSNVQPGRFNLNAEATDSQGRVLAAPPVNVTVVPTGMTIAYQHNFQTNAGAAWSFTTRSTGRGRTYLGPLGNASAVLSLSNVPANTLVFVAFDLLTIDSWDGSDTGNGPDVWDLSVEGGPTLLHTTFDNLNENSSQAFPGSYPGDTFPARTGAGEINPIGDNGGDVSSLYWIHRTFVHTNPVLQLDFAAIGITGGNDETWGLDNVLVAYTTNAADLSLAMEPGAKTVAVGDPLTFNLVVQNNGPLPATGVTLTSALPANVQFVSAVVSQGTSTNNAGQLRCSLGALPVGSVATVEFTVQPLDSRAVRQIAGVSADQPDLIPANNFATNWVNLPLSGTLFFSRNASRPKLKRVDFGYDGLSNFFVGPKLVITDLPDADGLALSPDGDLLVGSDVRTLYKVDVTTSNYIGASYLGGPVADHVSLDPSRNFAWVSSARDEASSGLVRIGLNPFGGSAQVFTIAGSETAVNSIDWDASGNLYYLSPTLTYFAHFGALTLGGATATASRLQPFLPGAHSMAFDPFTRNMIVFGANRIYQADVNRTNFTVRSELDLGGRGIIDLDLGQVDGKGHLFVADHGGNVVFLDYAQTGLINHPANYLSLTFLDAHLDDVAPTQLRGSTNIADLQMEISFTPEAWGPGTEIRMTITVRNQGPAAATSVQATAPLPPDVTVRSSQTSQGLCSITDAAAFCDFGTLASNGVASAALVLVSASDTPLRARATVTAAETDPLFVNNTQAALRYPFWLASITSVTNGAATIRVSAEPNRVYLLQSTSNFVNWTTIAFTNPPTTPFLLFDTGSNPSRRRFYRVIRP